jgi:predicted metal-dependent hydrolase
VKQSELDVLIARRERKVRRFFLWLWLVILPALGLVLYFGYFAPNYHPSHVDPPQVPTYNCASAAAALSNIDAGGQIAPLCGATPYPDSGGDG